MKLVSWKFKALVIAMVRLPDGMLLCTSKALCNALGLSEQALWNVVNRYKNRLHPIQVRTLGTQNESLKDFLNQYRDTFGIQRLRDDMLLWPLKEALGVAFHVHTNLAWEFHQAAIELVEKNAAEQGVSRTEWDALLTRMQNLEGAAPGLLQVAATVHMVN